MCDARARAALAERTLKAIALERKTIAGKAVEHARDLALARELSDHLRALLRDVVCNHLPADLGSLADELLLSGEEPSEDHVGGPETSSAVEVLGDGGEASEVLHVAV